MPRRRLAALVVIPVGTLLAACSSGDGREMQPPDSPAVSESQSTTPSTTTTPTTTPPATTLAASSASDSAEPAVEGVQLVGPWEDGEAIPDIHTCDADGDQVAPLLVWTAPPEGTVELALSVVVADTDNFTNWLVVGLPPRAGLAGGDEPLTAGTEAANSYDVTAWRGPCPPVGDNPHTYVFTLHLLDEHLELPADAPTADLLAAIEAATVGSATYTGTYERV